MATRRRSMKGSEAVLARIASMKDLEPGLRAMATRIVHAEDNFIEALMKLGNITKADAEKVYRVYQKLKVVKVDAVGGAINVTHGGFLDRSVIKRAVREKI